MKKKIADVVVLENENVPTEVLAEAIVRLSGAAERLQNSGLNRIALLVLLKHATGVHMSTVGSVLDALPKLATLYTQPKDTKRRQ